VAREVAAGGVTVLLGPARSGKTAAVLERYARAAAAGPGRALVLLPSATARADLLDRILAGGASAVASGDFLTFDGLARLALRLSGEAHGHLGDHLVRLMVSGVIDGEHAAGRAPFFDPIADTPGYPATMSAFLRELKQGGTDPDALSAILSAKGLDKRDRSVLSVYRAYQRRLHELGTYDRAGMLWQARDRLGEAPDLICAGVDLLAADGFVTFSPTELDMLRVLSGRVGETLVTLPCDERGGDLWEPVRRTREQLRRTFPDAHVEGLPPPGGSWPIRRIERRLFSDVPAEGVAESAGECETTGALHLLESRRALDQPREIARVVKRRIAEEGRRPSEFLIIARGAEGAADLYRAVFDEAGVPLDGPRRRRLTDSPIARALLGVARAHAGGWRREDVVAVFANTLLGVKDGVSAGDVERYAGACGIIDGIESWRAGRPAGPVDDADALEGVRSAIGSLSDLTLSKLPARSSPAAVCRGLIELGETLGLLNGRAAEGREGEDGAGALGRVLGELSQVDEPAWVAEAPLSRALGAVEAVLGEAKYEVARGEGGGVRLLDAHEARTVRAPVVFVTDLLEGGFPRQRGEADVYGSGARRRINEAAQAAGIQARLEEPRERQDDERMLFYLAVTRADEEVYLCYAASDDRGKPKLRSHYVDEALSASGLSADVVGPGGPTALIPEWGCCWSRRDVEVALCAGLWSRTHGDAAATPARHDALLSMCPPDDPHRLAAIMHGCAVEEGRRWAKRRGPYDSLLSGGDAQAFLLEEFGPDHRFSPSALSEYAACPFRFFALRVLGLSEPEAFEPGISALARGNIVHRALLRLFQAVESAGGIGGIESVEGAAARAMKKAAVELGWPGRAPLPGAAEAVLGMLGAWVVRTARAEADVLARDGAPQPAMLEAPFGFEAGPLDDFAIDTPAGPVRLCGVIDRVDFGAGAALVLDYKTGQTPAPKEVNEFRQLQLPIYLMAAWQLLAELGPPPEKGSAAYVDVRAGERRVRLSGEEADESGLPLAEHRRAVGGYVDAIRRGCFAADPPEKCVGYCGLRSLCRYDERACERKSDEA